MIPFLRSPRKETLGATYEQISKLIRGKDFDSSPFIKYNEKYSVFERKVQALIIDTLKLKEGVINCLLSGDPHLVRRILKCDWFFVDAIPPERYEEEIFPNVSYSTRCKIINQLSRNIKSEEDAEKLFQFTSKNYGNKLAEVLLARCSLEVVSDYFNNGNPSFNYHDSEKNLIKICQRFPDLVIPFFQKHMKKDGGRGSKIIRYLAKNHPLAVTSVLEEQSRSYYFFRFGKKTSKALRSEFMKLIEKTPVLLVINRMNMSVMFKELSNENRITFLKSLVRQCSRGPDYAALQDWRRATPQMKRFLELISPGERAHVVETVFSELYNENYLDHPEVWSFSFMALFPNDYRSRAVEILEKRCEEMEVKDALRSECSDRERDPKYTFISLMDFKNAFPLLTELMTQMTTVQRREILLKEMINNCVINNDTEGLESVMKYISIRHCEEDPRILCNVIMHNLMPFTKIINLPVWEWLEKIATLLMVRLSDAHTFRVVMENYIAYKMKNNLDAQPQVKSVLKLSVVPSPDSFILVRKMDKTYSRTLIMLYYKEIFSGDRDYSVDQIKEKIMLSLLMSVNEYNCASRRRKIKMRELPLLIEGIDKMVRRVRDWNSKQTLATAIKRNRYFRNKYASSLLDMTLKPKILRYLMKYHPLKVVDNFDRIVTYLLEYNENLEMEKIFAYGTQMDFFGCLPEIANVIADRFESAFIPTVKVKALRVYSHITNLEDFTELTKDYMPREEWFDFDASKSEFYDVVISVPGVIKNVQPISRNFDMVSQYLNKDYLRWVLPSFFAVCYNSPVSSIVPVLKERLTENLDVSVKKVILSCILDLLPKDEKFQYCQTLWQNEKHSSVTEFVFHAISRSLRDDGSDDIFEMVKKCVKEANEITINGRLKIRMIPPRYQNEYAIALWEFADKYDGKNVAVTCRREVVHHFRGEHISILSQEMCQKVLKMYLLQVNAEILVEKFCVDYLVYHPQPVEEKLNFFLTTLNERETNQRSLKYFVHSLKNAAKKNPKPVFPVFEGLLKEWRKLYGISKMFKEYLLVEYMNAYGRAFKSSELKKELFGAHLGAELRKIVNSIPNYRFYIEVFKMTLSEFINEFKFHDVLDLMLDNFLGSSFDDVEGIIAIHLIPTKVLNSLVMNTNDPSFKNSNLIELREKFRSVFRKLVDKNNDVLKIFLNIRTNNGLD